MKPLTETDILAKIVNGETKQILHVHSNDAVGNEWIEIYKINPDAPLGKGISFVYKRVATYDSVKVTML